MNSLGSVTHHLLSPGTVSIGLKHFLTWTFLTDETKVAVQTSMVSYWAKTLDTK